jgi:hypothetical protein
VEMLGADLKHEVLRSFDIWSGEEITHSARLFFPSPWTWCLRCRMRVDPFPFAAILLLCGSLLGQVQQLVSQSRHGLR